MTFDTKCAFSDAFRTLQARFSTGDNQPHELNQVNSQKRLLLFNVLKFPSRPNYLAMSEKLVNNEVAARLATKILT